MNNFAFSPFIVPVAGCLVAIVAIVSGIWLDGHKRRMKSEERIAMLARGVPLAEIEKMLGPGDEEKPAVKDRARTHPRVDSAYVLDIRKEAMFGMVPMNIYFTVVNLKFSYQGKEASKLLILAIQLTDDARVVGIED